MRIETERLALRPLSESDRVDYARLNADPEVMRFFPAIKTAAESDIAFNRFLGHHAELGFGFAATELRDSGRFIGIVGVAPVIAELHAALPGHPEFEIGWLLAKDVWGQGLAPEGARAVLGHVWAHFGLDEIIAITARRNLPSRRVMEKIGMRHDPRCDYDNPIAPEGHPNRPHVVYRVRKP